MAPAQQPPSATTAASASQVRPAGVTLRKLLADDSLSGAEVLAGSADLDHVVVSVTRAFTPRLVDALPAGTLAIFSRDDLPVESLTMDVTLRLASSAGLAGLIVDRPNGEIPVSTRNLANRCGIPLIGIEQIQPQTLLPALNALVNAPEVFTAQLISTVVNRLRRAEGREARDLVQALQLALGIPAALVDPEGGLMAGDHAVGSAIVDSNTHLNLAALSNGGGTVVLRCQPAGFLIAQPVELAGPGSANFWIAVLLPDESAIEQEAITVSLSVAAWAFAAFLGSRSLREQRVRSQRSALLSLVLKGSGSPTRHTLEQATLLGWRLWGWHVGIELELRNGPDVTEPIDVPAVVTRICDRHKIHLEFFEHSAGWVGWSTSDAKPEDAKVQALCRTLGNVLLEAERELADGRLCAGVGRAHKGVLGLKETLSEAGQARLLAHSRNVGGAVEYAGSFGVRQLLVDWIASDIRREAACVLLEPLTAADPTGVLVQTLGSYLDSESSVVTTAAVLGVHRNTVLARLERVRHILPADLSRSDDRLAVQLAARLVLRESGSYAGGADTAIEP